MKRRRLVHLLDDLAWQVTILLHRDRGGIRWGHR